MSLDKHSVRFFDSQFQNQLASGEFALNPFEQCALPHLRGELLDLGCGLGNLALAAARRGCQVTALDGSPNAVARIRAVAEAEHLPVTAEVLDLAHYRIDRDYDSIVSIGLLMFFPEAQARAALDDIGRHIRPGGVVALNVLTEGTTFLSLFDPGHSHLFSRDALRQHFADWEIIESRHDSFPAPEATVKAFATLVARRPEAG